MKPERVVGEQVRRVRLRVEDLHRRARSEGDALPALVEEALEALYTSLEELQGSEEALRRQHEELAATQARLDEERLRYLELFQHAPDAYLVTGSDGVIQEANHAAAELLNAGIGRLSGKPLAAFVPRERRREFRQRIAQALELGRLDGWETLVGPRGAAPLPVVCTVTAVRPGAGRSPGLRWLVRDRTEQLQAADARRSRFLAEVGEVLSSSLEYDEVVQAVARVSAGTLADYCVVHAQDGDRIRALAIAHGDRDREERVREIFDASPEVPATHPVAVVLRTGEPERIARVDARVLARLGVDEGHHGALREMGLSSALVVPVRARGETLGTLSLIRAGGEAYDAADLATAEEIARRAAVAVENAKLYREARRAVAARDEMVAVLSHDLRNPLNSVLIASTVLAEYGEPGHLSERDRTQVEIIRRAATQMTELVQDLLDVSALESGAVAIEAAPLEVETLLAAAREMFSAAAEQAGIALECAGAGEVPPVRGDYGRLLQVLSNVVGNAVKFTPRGGRVEVGAERAAECVRFRVADTGPGIAREHLPRLFDRFWQARRGAHAGSGLGLAIARSIVEAHGGKIWAECTPGAGAVFHFTLPVAGGGGTTTD